MFIFLILIGFTGFEGDSEIQDQVFFDKVKAGFDRDIAETGIWLGSGIGELISKDHSIDMSEYRQPLWNFEEDGYPDGVKEFKKKIDPKQLSKERNESRILEKKEICWASWIRRNREGSYFLIIALKGLIKESERQAIYGLDATLISISWRTLMTFEGSVISSPIKGGGYWIESEEPSFSSIVLEFNSGTKPNEKDFELVKNILAELEILLL